MAWKPNVAGLVIRPVEPADSVADIRKLVIDSLYELQPIHTDLVLAKTKFRIAIGLISCLLYPCFLGLISKTLKSVGNLPTNLLAGFIAIALGYFAVRIFLAWIIGSIYSDEEKRMADLQDIHAWYGEGWNDKKAFYVAMIGSELVGTIAIDSTFYPHVVGLKRFCVRPSHRRCKIATHLLEAAKKHAIKQGFRYAQLNTTEVMTASHKLLRQRGYEIVSTKLPEFTCEISIQTCHKELLPPHSNDGGQRSDQ